jgi:hypothetical protein
MTREEAVAECRRLASEHPDAATHSWLPRELDGGDWTVAKVGLRAARPLATAQAAKPRPPQADDPRPPMWRDVGGPYGAA